LNLFIDLTSLNRRWC